MRTAPRPAPLRLAAAAALAVAAAVSAPAAAQGPARASVQIAPGYAHAFTLADSAVGAGGPALHARLHAPVAGRLGLHARLGLDHVGIDQPDAVERWGWGYWDVLWRSWSRTYDSRDDIDGAFRPVQHALVVSGALAPSVSVGGEARSATLWAGPSLSYFTRRLYREETWLRRYPTADSTTFQYTIRNYAPDKTGLRVGVEAGLSARQRLTAGIDLGASVSYRRMTWETRSVLPFNDLLSVDLGVAVRY